MGQGYPGTACNGKNFGQFDFNAHFGQDSQCPHFHSNVRRLILINDRYRICTILVRCLIRTPDTKTYVGSIFANLFSNYNFSTTSPKHFRLIAIFRQTGNYLQYTKVVGLLCHFWALDRFLLCEPSLQLLASMFPLCFRLCPQLSTFPHTGSTRSKSLLVQPQLKRRFTHHGS